MTDEEIYNLWDARYRGWVGAEQFEVIFKHAASIEREACAQICETRRSNWNYCAKDIRARGSN